MYVFVEPEGPDTKTTFVSSSVAISANFFCFSVKAFPLIMNLVLRPFSAISAATSSEILFLGIVLIFVRHKNCANVYILYMAKNLKIEILNNLSSSMSPYAATQWLKKPLVDFNDKTPSEVIKKGKKKDIDMLLNIVKELKKK